MSKKSSFYDYNLIAVILLLTCFGLVMLYSTSAYTAEIEFGDDMFFFRRQAIITAATIVIAMGISLIDYHILWNFSWLIYIGSTVLMIAVRFVGSSSHGARRWLKIGIEFQPAEIAKIAVITFVPMLIIRIGRDIKRLTWVLLLMTAGLALSVIALVFTDNLSTAIIIFAIDWVIVFVAHPKTRPFIITAVIVLILTVIGVLWLWNVAEMGMNFRIDRILVWQNPEKYSGSGGYQIMQALYAIGSGGFFGKGLGNSMQKLGWLPEAQNDMIFPIIIEELGIFGGLIVLILYLYLLYRLMFIAQNAPDEYGTLMVTGVFAHVAVQVIFNICVVLNLIPATGVTLPFISYGGTSVFFLMMEIAIALSVSRRIYLGRDIEKPKDLWGDVVETGAAD